MSAALDGFAGDRCEPDLVVAVAEDHQQTAVRGRVADAAQGDQVVGKVVATLAAREDVVHLHVQVAVAVAAPVPVPAEHLVAGLVGDFFVVALCLGKHFGR